MIELEKHIETLLLDKNCVIIPDLGGFMTHNVRAVYDEDSHSFFPPIQTLGFNPQLDINDSQLVLSYVDTYDISYPEALSKIEEEVRELRQIIENEGCYELNSIGKLYLNEEGNIEFSPCEAGILTPSLYGLSSFEMLPISESAGNIVQSDVETELAEADEAPEKISEEKDIISKGITTDEKSAALNAGVNTVSGKENGTIHIRTSWVRNAVAAAIVITAFFLVSTPLENGMNLLSESKIDTGMLQKIMPKNITTNTPEIKVMPKKPAIKEKTEEVQKEDENKNISQMHNYYTVVLASKISKTNAENYVSELHKKGFDKAKSFERNKTTRVVYGEYANESDAYAALREIRHKGNFEDSWVMRVK